MSRCPICRQTYTKTRTFQKCCENPDCAAQMGRVLAASRKLKARREEVKADRAKRESLKTRAEWLKDAQVAFNGYIRARDAGKTCICCDQPLQGPAVGGGFDCGHYRSTGSAPHLRFNEDNAHGQTKQCNRWGAGRAVDYRLGLIKRIGLERVERLESDTTLAKWTIDDLKEIIAKYKAMEKELRKQQ